MWVMRNLISVHLETCWFQCKIGAWFALNVPQARKLFWTHPMELLGDMGQVEAHFGPFGDSTNLDAI
jgi:hypothetical protein